MVKKLFGWFMAIVSLVLIYLIITKKPTPIPIYLDPEDKIVPSTNNQIKECVDLINQKNAQIKSILVSDMPIKLQQKNGFIIKANGFLAMEKERKLKLIVTHKLTGKELDIGSNKDVFWFWSKRMNPPALYYSSHEDLDKTRLKTVFNPDWMMESLNFSEIKDGFRTGKLKDYFAIIQDKESIKIITLIDPVQKVTIGRYLYQNDKLLASTEYLNFLNGISQKINVNWYEESIYMEWDLSNLKINPKINSANWNLPNYKNKINMAD